MRYFSVFLHGLFLEEKSGRKLSLTRFLFCEETRKVDAIVKQKFGSVPNLGDFCRTFFNQLNMSACESDRLCVVLNLEVTKR